MPPRLAIIGTGKMGRAIASLAKERGWLVVAEIDEAGNAGGAGITRESLAGAEVAVEFTVPAAAPDNIRACLRAGCPVVVGTTGWRAELEAVSREVSAAGGALLFSPNFSIGVNLFWRAAEQAARLLAKTPGFDAHIVETHHAAKKDAPSGTALELQRLAQAALGRSIPVTSVRTGSVPGSHELIFDGSFEQIRLEHHARDRRVFAEGALVAAQWLVGRKGIYGLSDVLG
jgi:4-hydroxy-tetrahydrodipicolinate reductase